MGYTSYSVVMTHAGYDYHSAVAIVKNFVPSHAELIQNEFYRADKRYLNEIFLCERMTAGTVDYNEKFKASKFRPDCGFGIGPASDAGGADPGTSFSLGIYFKIKGDPSGDVYATSVAHGPGKDSAPTEWGSAETVPIQVSTTLEGRSRRL
jgi:hypothetical protein